MREVPFLKTLEESGVPITDEIRERMDMVIAYARREPGAEQRLKEYGASQKGGANAIPIPVIPSQGDFLGPEMRWLVEVLGSPYLQIAIRMLFTVLFFVSYLEKIPVFGSILSAVLDLTVTGGKVLVKMVQKFIPPMLAIIPLPFMSIVGLVFAALFGMLLWPVIAIVSFSRQEFTTAIEAMFRIIPPPFGDAVADAFLDANRTAYRMNEKRKQLVEDIITGLKTVMTVGETAKDKVTSGADILANRLTEIIHGPNALKEKASGLVGDAKEKSSSLFGSMKDKLSAMSDKSAEVKEKSSGMFGSLKEKSSGLMSALKSAKSGDQEGGQALSRRRRKKHKWRTQRRPTK